MPGINWLKVDCGIFDHPKTLRFARILHINRIQAVGHLTRLWTWGVQVYPDGILSGADPEDIATAAEWEGNPEEFITALMTCGKNSKGFLEIDDQGTYFFHDWEEYGGQLLKKRRANAERQSRYRARNSSTAEASTPGPSDQLNISAEFDKIWLIYPKIKGVSKAEGMAVFRQARKDYSYDQLFKGLTGYKDFLRAHPEEERMPAECFFDGRWKDFLGSDCVLGG